MDTAFLAVDSEAVGRENATTGGSINCYLSKARRKEEEKDRQNV